MTVVRKKQRGPDGKNVRREADNEAKAVLKMVRISPRKLNLVAQSIRGLRAEKAVNELTFSRKRISDDVLKCLQSAIANAENNHNLDIDKPRGRGSPRRQESRDEAHQRARPGSCGADREALFPADHRRARHQHERSRRGRLMGQKVNPIGLRLGINRTWDSRWYANTGEYGRLLHQDLKIRKMLREKLAGAGISRIIIERPLKKCRVTIYTAKPGVVIGKKGADIEKLRKDLSKMVEGHEVFLNLVEVRKPETDAMLVAEGIAQQLERRVAFRRAMKRAMQSTMRLGGQGIRINVSGRLGGAEIARMEWYREGRVPLHTLRADIDYGFCEAKTAYGQIGVKVWIFKGEILEHDPMAQDRRAMDAGENRERRDRDQPRGPRSDDRPRAPRGRRRETETTEAEGTGS